MELGAYPTEALLAELNKRGKTGVVALYSPSVGRVETWWGDRMKCLGLTMRLTGSINSEICDFDEEDEGEDEANPVELEFPQMGQYL